MPPKHDKPGPSRNTRSALAVCALLLLAIAAIYGQTLGFKLLGYDDGGFVYDNPQITAGITAEGIRWAFTEGPFGEWYPLDPLSHMLDCQLFGLDAGGHHLTSVLLHAAASIGLFWVFWRITAQRAVPGTDRRLVAAKVSGVRADEGEPERDNLLPSALVAALFAVHPQHVESVAWVSERRDVLSGLCFVLTLGAYLGYVRHNRPLGRYLLVVAMLALGLMAKPMLVTLPALLLLLDFWPLDQFGAAADVPDQARSVTRPGLARLLLEKVPLAALAAADCWLTVETHYAVTSEPIGWGKRIGNAAVALVSYLGDFFYPLDLAAFYPLPPAGQPTWKVIGAIAILVAISAVAVINRRRWPYLFVGWFWYLGMLVPVSGLVGVADHARADRYMYLPGIGLYLALAWSGARAAAAWPAARRPLAVGAVVWICLLTACAARQTSFWRDDITLWNHALDCTADNATADVSLGAALTQQGEFQRAIKLYRDALAIRPNWYEAHEHLGSALGRVGQFPEAMQHLRRAMEINPSKAQTYIDLGELFLLQGRFDEARAAFREALAREPQSVPAYNILGVSYFLQGRYAEAIQQYQQALAIAPNFVLAHVNMAEALAAAGQTDAALAHFLRALDIAPNDLAARTKFQAFLQAHPELRGIAR